MGNTPSAPPPQREGFNLFFSQIGRKSLYIHALLLSNLIFLTTCVLVHQPAAALSSALRSHLPQRLLKRFHGLPSLDQVALVNDHGGH